MKTERLAVETKAFGAIRLNPESRHWLQIDSLSPRYEEAVSKAQLANKQCGPSWAEANPIAYYSEFDILENHEVERISH